MAAKKVFLVVDRYSHDVLGIFPSLDEAQVASNNTAAYTVVYEARVTELGD